jgi:hypothetical protein
MQNQYSFDGLARFERFQHRLSANNNVIHAHAGCINEE